MFLVDSSVWIEYFRPAKSKKIKNRVKDLLRSGSVVTCGIIQVEVLRGIKNEKDFNEVCESFYSLPVIHIDEDVIKRAARWGYEMDRKGKILPTTDLIIAAAAFQKARLLHLDADFKVIAECFPLEEEMLA
ncbi:MAG: PIN domain nuclease [Candidatus Aminicenantales bacterium]